MNGIEVSHLGFQAAKTFLLIRLMRRFMILPANHHIGFPALFYPPEVMKRMYSPDQLHIA